MNATIEGADGRTFRAMDLGIPGLVIALTDATDGTPIWSVTHVDSRTCVCWFENPETAAKAAFELAALGDWTADAAIVTTAIDGRAVRRIRDANGGSSRCSLGTYSV